MIKLTDILSEIKADKAKTKKRKIGDEVEYKGKKYKIEAVSDLLIHLALSDPNDRTSQEKESGHDGRISVNPKFLPEGEGVISDGINDPGILKCIFLAGGPGSGKSFVAKDLFGVGDFGRVSPAGLKHISSDVAFEVFLKKVNVDPKDLARIKDEDPDLFDKLTGEMGSVRSRAKDVTQKQQSLYKSGKLGLIVDGTGENMGGIKNKKEEMEELGYDCYMVFVNTSLEVAMQRNSKRDRRLPNEFVKTLWKKCQENLGHFQSMFGNNFTIVDNTEVGPVEDTVKKRVDQFLSEPIKNPIGKQWMRDQRSKNTN